MKDISEVTTSLDICGDLPSPSCLFEINTGSEYLALLSEAQDRTDAFEIIYRCKGIECKFECDITTDDVYCFYTALDTAYDINCCKNSKAVLENYSDERTHIEFEFDNECRCTVTGHIKNKSARYKSGIEFSLAPEQSDICGVLMSLERFFRELKQ